MRPTRESELAAEIAAAAAEGSRRQIVGSGSLAGRWLDGATPTITAAGLTGIVDYTGSDCVVRVRAGTPLAELAAELATVGQEVPIETAGATATVGGAVATGISGLRRLGAGPTRDWVLGARLIVGTGDVVAIGGATLKNVTGYDLPKLLCGSWGRLGLLTEVILRTRVRPADHRWWVADGDVDEVAGGLYDPAAVLYEPGRVHVLLEGHPDDVGEQAASVGLAPGAAPVPPPGARLSVPPGELPRFLAGLAPGWLAEWQVGVVHLAAGQGGLAGLRAEAEACGGRLLVLDGPAGVRGPGAAPAGAWEERIRRAFDPHAVFA